MALKTETNTPQMGNRVLKAARAYFKRRKVEAFFEHGQWFVRFDTNSQDKPTETYSVVDAEGGESVDGFSFEEL